MNTKLLTAIKSSIVTTVILFDDKPGILQCIFYRLNVPIIKQNILVSGNINHIKEKVS